MQLLKVSGMSCGHCVGALTKAIQALDPAAQVEVDLHAGQVKVSSSLSIEQLIAAIDRAGFDAQAV